MSMKNMRNDKKKEEEFVMIEINNEEYFLKSYKEIINKIIEFKFLLYQYSGEMNFKLVELLDLKKTSEENMGVRLKTKSNLNLYINILIMTYSKLKEPDKNKCAEYLEEVIKELYKLYFQLDLEGYERIIDVLKFYGIYEYIKAKIVYADTELKGNIELKDSEDNKYNIQVYNDGLKIYKNNIFIKGCYYGMTREEISSIDLLKKYRW
ncbi:MAG: hypothetical protein KH415_17325 [Clostridium sp.]|nr:hypothetical protein [Clostridium sp.]